MKKYVKSVFLVLIGLAILGVGVTYAFFNYTKTGQNNKLIAGSLYLTMNEGNDTVNLSNMLPESKEEARDTTKHVEGASSDNTLTFTLKGKNTSTTKAINYEIILNNGTDNPNNIKQRINPKDLMFDLIEVGPNNTETYVLDAVSYDTLENQRIWVDKVNENTTTEIERTYRLRVWVSDSIIVSDSDPNRDYTTEQFKNLYASVKIAVEGDLEDKKLPLTVASNDLLVQNNQTYVNNVIENSETENNEDTFNLTITSSNSNIDFEYNNDPVVSNIESNIINSKVRPLVNDENELVVRRIDNESPVLNTFTQNFTIPKDKKVTFKLFLISVNGNADTTDLSFTLKKNNVVIQEFVRHVNVLGRDLPVPHIEFVNKNETYTGNAITLDNVTITNSNNESYTGTATYTYYKGSTCQGQQIASAPVNVGSYSVKIHAPSVGTDGATDACGTITINQKSLTPSVTNCDNRNYNGTTNVNCNLGLTGVVANERIDLDATCSTSDANVGDNKTVTCANLALKGDGKDNYSLSSSTVNATININKAPLTIKADSKSIDYGGSAPTYTYTAIGFVNNETNSVLSGSPVYTVKNREGTEVTINSSTEVGTYFINVTGLTASNYDIIYTSGTLLVMSENTVTYDCTTNGGTTANSTETVSYGQAVDLSKTCEKSGWEFYGWNTDPNATTVFNSYTMKNSAVSLYAIYRKPEIVRTMTLYKNDNVAFTSNGARYTDNVKTFTMCTIPAVYNNGTQPTTCTETIDFPTIEAPTNTPTIIGWSTGADVRTPTYTSGQSSVALTMTENLTYYAQTSNSPSTITIDFDVNGNNGTNSTDSCTPPTVYNGDDPITTCSITSPSISPAAATPTVKGWSSASDNHIISWPAATAVNVSTSATYYAQTEASEKTYTLTYDNNGATGSLATDDNCTILATYNGTSQAAGCSVTLAQEPVKTLKVFVGWTSSVDSNDYSAQSSYVLTTNTTMTAHWRNVNASDLQYDNANAAFASCTAPNNSTQCALDVIAGMLNPS